MTCYSKLVIPNFKGKDILFPRQNHHNLREGTNDPRTQTFRFEPPPIIRPLNPNPPLIRPFTGRVSLFLD